MLDLNNQKNLEALKWHANQVLSFDLVEKARLVSSFLEKKLADGAIEQPEEQLACQELLIRVKFISLPLLDSGEVSELLKSNFISVFEIPDYDLWDKLKVKLIAIPRFEDRDALKKKVREALLLNEQILTVEEVVSPEKKARGTVKNWLTDYHQALGTGKVETIKLSQYLINSPGTKSLSDGSRQKLDYLLKLYEKMKLSSLDLEGIEETTLFVVGSELDVYKEGMTERIGREIKDMVRHTESIEAVGEIQDEIEAKYRGDEAEAKKIEAEMKKITKITGKDFKKLSSMLFSAIPGPGRAADKIQIAAILRILAESGQLGNLLEEKEFSEMMAAYFKNKNKKSELEGFKINPQNPEYLGMFLKHILIDKAGMSEDDSGRIGMQLFNALAAGGDESKYQGLVYFDLEEKKFKWA